MDNKIILSICIPTYNRCEVLDKTLETYVTDDAFDERIEIIISDNCSTDHTEKVVGKYLNKYHNITYERLQKNISAELNYISVLSRGTGLYLKLMNDSVSLKPGVLKTILNIINSGKNEMNPIFFYQNICFSHSNEVIHCDNLNDLVSNVSFWITWIANFGIWRKDFETLENKDKAADLQFTQVDWTFRIINKTGGIIHFGDFYSGAELKNKGGYNVFEIFGINYLSLYKEYLESKSLSYSVFNTEKYRLFRHFLMGWYQILVLTKESKYIFEKNDAIKILMKNYKYKLYFYLGIIFLKLRSSLKQSNS